jgi:hypothetical protein
MEQYLDHANKYGMSRFVSDAQTFANNYQDLQLIDKSSEEISYSNQLPLNGYQPPNCVIKIKQGDKTAYAVFRNGERSMCFSEQEWKLLNAQADAYKSVLSRRLDLQK